MLQFSNLSWIAKNIFSNVEIYKKFQTVVVGDLTDFAFINVGKLIDFLPYTMNEIIFWLIVMRDKLRKPVNLGIYKRTDSPAS